jgi:hypothetical protein
MRRMEQIVTSSDTPHWRRAEECLEWLASDETHPEDMARPDFRAAAQTFALLAIADALDEVTATLKETTIYQRDAV